VYYPIRCYGGCPPPPKAILTLPITGLPALLLQQGPVALIVVALFSLLLVGIARGLKQQIQARAAAAPATEMPPKEPASASADAALVAYLAGSPIAPLPGKPKLWKRPVSLAVISLVLVGLMLCALVPLSNEVFNDIGAMDIASVSMVSASEGWAVGDFFQDSIGNVRGVIWHYHNGQWTPMLSPTKYSLSAVSALPDGEAWAVGYNGTLLHEVGGNWTQEASGTTDDLSSIAMISPTEGWAVGGAYPIASVNNRSVAGITAPAAHSRFSPALTSRPSDDFLCTILHYTAGHWSPVTCPEINPMIAPLESVAGLPDGEAWAVGYAGIFHEQQGVWKQVPSPGRLGLRSIALVSATEGWAVGNTGIILHEVGGVWSQALQADAPYLNAVAVSSTGEVWIVGGSGSMLHGIGGNWTSDTIPAVTTDDSLNAVTLLPGGEEGWAVGANQLILHLHNGVWSLYSRQASSELPQ
jgi:hypothetical protein